MMTKLRFYNTLTRKKEPFTPIDANNVRLYVCGPTVYDYAHIGNARPVIVFDTLFRLLRHSCGESHVRYIRNITDVDDKINARAARDYPDLPLNAAIAKLTRRTEKQFHDDVAALNCLKPSKEPRATENISKMKALIERLVKNGHAYIAENHVVFSVAAMDKSAAAPSALGKNPPYGRLSRRPQAEMLAGARVEVASYKRGPRDFVLWKPSGAGEPGWESPCGIKPPGRPGWHIECSAMSMAELLEPCGGGLSCEDPQKNRFDIHGGGLDLIFPHHENEIAQSCCALGAPHMANFWLHNGFLQVEGRKMSKSEGNFITIRQILKTELPQFNEFVSAEERRRWAGLAARFSMLQTHYREPLNWTQKRFEEASAELYKWHQFLRSPEGLKEIPQERGHSKEIPQWGESFFDVPEVIEPLRDDLNTPAAIAGLRRCYAARAGGKLRAALSFLGLDNGFGLPGRSPLFYDKRALAQRRAERKLSSEDRLDIEARIEARLAALEKKNWKAADKLRDDLARRGIKLTDYKDESGARRTRWEIG